MLPITPEHPESHILFQNSIHMVWSESMTVLFSCSQTARDRVAKLMVEKDKHYKLGVLTTEEFEGGLNCEAIQSFLNMLQLSKGINSFE